MSRTKDGRIKHGTKVQFAGEGVVWRSSGTEPWDSVEIEMPPAKEGQWWGRTVWVRNMDIVSEEEAG